MTCPTNIRVKWDTLRKKLKNYGNIYQTAGTKFENIAQEGGIVGYINTTSSKTSDEIKTLAETLGDAFKNSTERDCYPKLSWEE